MGMEQPSVSKHLRVLLEVGLVHVRRDGRRMLYRTNAEAIRPLHEWTETFERFWRHQLSRIKERAERKSNPSNDGGPDFIRGRKDDLDRNKN
jgi:Mn-dependent DtxR family transcriptional regulator